MGRSVANAGPHVMVMTVRRNTFRSCRRTVTFFVFKSVITRRKGGRASEGGFIVAYTRLRGRKLDGSVRKRSALVCENVIRRLKRGMNVGQVEGGGRRTGVLRKLTSSAEYDLTASKGGAFDGVRI